MVAASPTITPLGSRAVTALSSSNRELDLNRGGLPPHATPKYESTLRTIPISSSGLTIGNRISELTSSNDFRRFISGHPLQDLIGRPLDQLISTDEISQRIIGISKDGSIQDPAIDFEIGLSDKGAMPASTSAASSYSRFGWTRDMANKARALIDIGMHDEAKKVITCLAKTYNKPEFRDQIASYLWHPDFYPDQPRERYASGDGGHPPIRFAIDQSGELTRSNQGWAHNQIDAVGAWLHVTFYLANKIADKDPNFLRDLDTELKSQNVDKPQYNTDSILSVTFKALNKIHCWNNYDAGAWEDYSQLKRASSVGIVLAATREAKKFFNTNGYHQISIFNHDDFIGSLNNLDARCEQTLEERIPKNGEFAVECDSFPSDAALAFLLYPYNPGLTDEQEKAILKTIYQNRMGTVGISRRDHDEYVGSGYNTNVHSSGIYANKFTGDYKPAEWTLFDPILSTHFLNKVEKRLSERGEIDQESLELSEFHLRRSLAHITKEKSAYMKRHYSGADNGHMEYIKITVDKKKLPEAFFFDYHYLPDAESEPGRWLPNENSPLLWTEANNLIMLNKQQEVKALLEKYYSDIWQIAPNRAA
jgi:hypothetical protein